MRTITRVCVVGILSICSLATTRPASAAPAPPRLAFTDASGQSLFVLEEGGRPERIVAEPWPDGFGEGSWLQDPSWAPDGRHIAYARTEYAGLFVSTGEIRIVDAHGRGSRTVVRVPVAGIPRGVTWSPDGRRLAFELWTINHAVALATWTGIASRSDVYVVNIDGSGLRPVAPWHPSWHPHGMGRPTWSPDRRRLAFASDVEGVLAVYTAPADGVGAMTRVSPLGMEAHSPVWSPDGGRIGFLARPLGLTTADALWVATRDGGRARELVSGVRDAPSWSPDSRQLAFGSATGIWTVPVDPPARTVRVTTDGSDARPAWSATGDIAFRRGPWGKGRCGLYAVTPGHPERKVGPCDVGSLAWSPR